MSAADDDVSVRFIDSAFRMVLSHLEIREGDGKPAIQAGSTRVWFDRGN
jgi:hypothetical protein